MSRAGNAVESQAHEYSALHGGETGKPVTLRVSRGNFDNRPSVVSATERRSLGISTQPPGYRSRKAMQRGSPTRCAATWNNSFSEPISFLPVKGLHTKVPELLGRQDIKIWNAAMRTFLSGIRHDVVLTGGIEIHVNAAQLRDYL